MNKTHEHFTGLDSLRAYAALIMVVIYFLTWIFSTTGWLLNNIWMYTAVYYLVTFAGTILLSAISYEYFESPLLAHKSRFGGSRSRALQAALLASLGS